MKKTLKSIVLCFLILIYSCKSKEEIESQLKMEIVTTGGIHFKHNNFKSAKEDSKKQNKFLLVYVTSDGCRPCFQMEKEVFSNPLVYNFFNKEFVCSKIHIVRTSSAMPSKEYDALNGMQTDFLEFHNVEPAFPTFLIFDHNGNLIKKLAKFMNSDEFIEFGKKILNDKNTSGNNV
jgi:thioredoxin-related protein